MSYYGPNSYFQLGRINPRTRVREPFARRKQVLSTALFAVPVTMTAGTGLYTITGEPATLTNGTVVAFGAGSIVISGQALTPSQTVTLGRGSLAITGQAATTTVVMAADAGYYLITASKFLPNATVPVGPNQTTGQGASPGWKPRSIYDLLALDSPLTLDQIRAKFPAPAQFPAQASAPPLPYLGLAPTPNLMQPDDSEAEEFQELMAVIGDD